MLDDLVAFRSRLGAANVFGGIGSPSGVREVPRRSVAALTPVEAANTEPVRRRCSFTNERLALAVRPLASSSATVGIATMLQCRSRRAASRESRASAAPCRADPSLRDGVRATPLVSGCVS